MLAVDQDGIAALRIRNAPAEQVFAKRERAGDVIVGLFNTSTTNSQQISIGPSAIGLPAACAAYALENLWSHRTSARDLQLYRSCWDRVLLYSSMGWVEEMPSFLRAGAVFATLFLGSCAASIAYRATYVPDGPPSPVHRVKGRVLVFTTFADDNRWITPGATSVTAFKMNVQAGVMAREIATTVFSRVADGADDSHDLANADRYSIVLRPQIENLEYGFTHPKHLGIEVTPQVRVVMRITCWTPPGVSCSRRTTIQAPFRRAVPSLAKGWSTEPMCWFTRQFMTSCCVLPVTSTYSSRPRQRQPRQTKLRIDSSNAASHPSCLLLPA